MGPAGYIHYSQAKLATVSLMCSKGYRATCREFNIKDKLDDDNVNLGLN